jgi:hypothetical protein
MSERIEHIGSERSPWTAMCGRKLKNAGMRCDLGADRYRRLGVTELLRDQKPYHVCKRCIAKVERGEV